MIITDDFVMINFPKTGSTFARKMIQDIHCYNKYNFIEKFFYKIKFVKKPFFQILETPNIRNSSNKYKFMDEHGIYKQVPEIHKHKRLMTIKRDVFSRYISMYEFKDWQRAPWLNEKELKVKFDNYPDISFHDFVTLIIENNQIERLPDINKKLLIGPTTAQFILFYFKEPFKILNTIDEAYIQSDNYKNDMINITFLDQGKLNQELYDFLLSVGYKKNKIKFILEAQKINNSTPKGKTINDYFTKDLYDYISYHERFLLKIMEDLKKEASI